MKKGLWVLVFGLWSLCAFAQRYTVLDTAYTVNVLGAFFEVHDVTYSNGEQTTTKTLIGDTATYFNASFERFQDEARRMAIQAQAVFSFDKRLRDLKKESDKILAATGKDILDTIAVRNLAFLDSGWKVRDTTATDVAFSINANGQLRYQITGFQTRNADLFGDAIILNNYKSAGKDVFLFKTESGNYRNRDGDTLLRRPGGPQFRVTIEKKAEAAPVVEPVQKEMTKKKGTAKKKKQ